VRGDASAVANRQRLAERQRGVILRSGGCDGNGLALRRVTPIASVLGVWPRLQVSSAAQGKVTERPSFAGAAGQV